MKQDKQKIQASKLAAENSNKFSTIVVVLIVLLLLSSVFAFSLSIFDEEVINGNVARIKIDGEITTQKSYRSASSQEIVSLIEKAQKNDDVKAILFEINSPGGSPVASYEIADAIKKTNKTTVALIREVGASGAYWVATSTDYIIANPLSVTGSIGVIGSYLQFSGIMENYNVTYERLTYGKYKDMGSPFKELTKEERAKIQSEIDLIGDYFVNEVAKNRNLSYGYVKNLSTGEIFIGMRAKELGLIDQTGSFDEAQTYLKEKLNTTEIEYADYNVQRSFSDILAEISNNFGFRVGEGIGSSFKEESALNLKT